jgi:hypothetical protein
MSALLSSSGVWSGVELPVVVQRRVGWDLLSRVAEQQLRRGASCVLDPVAREEPGQEWAELAQRYGVRFGVIECLCSDEMIHRSRIEGRDRGIPGWNEFEWAQVAAGREGYQRLSEPKLILDAVTMADTNLSTAMEWISSLSASGD